MSEKRRDTKGRILHIGEMQLSDGRYRFKYTDLFGSEKVIYSWRLTRNDPQPFDKKPCSPLRDVERKIQADLFDHIASEGGRMTVLDLVEKYIETKTGVRPSTRADYQTVFNFLKKDPMGKRRIDTVKTSDAKLWLIRLQKKEKKSFSAIHQIRGVINPAFKMAVEDDLIRLGKKIV